MKRRVPELDTGLKVFIVIQNTLIGHFTLPHVKIHWKMFWQSRRKDVKYKVVDAVFGGSNQ
ncbi:MAG TPA: hypothetical protein DEO65_09285 [Bacillus bacterium]|uniref:hypothetical protein n=1 Tax=Siminovitchia fordii TaxID=254759 RepID=UPI0003769A83|nr:hypothetical protein [Siminovitchia fordii]HBZ10053.1 hypothetical protein [Bacillus sp. (in: firmicutes)]